MATTKRSPADRVRALLMKNKALTEKEVLGRVKGTSRKEIRALRVSLGIDRQSAIADARGWLAKEPGLPAARLISDILATYGVRLGPPDVSRLRPVKKKTGRRPTGLPIGGGKSLSLFTFPTQDQEIQASLVARYLKGIEDSLAGNGGRKAKRVREAADLIARDMLDPTSRIEALEARVKKLEGGKR